LLVRSNFIVRLEGSAPRVAEKVFGMRLRTTSLLLGAAMAGTIFGLCLGRRAKHDEVARRLKDWPVNIAHHGGAGLAPENTLEGFREGLRAGAGALELDVHAAADGSGPVCEMTLAEIGKLDAGYPFTQDGDKTYPYRGKGLRVPTLEEVYQEFPEVPINVEIKAETRPGVGVAVWRVIEAAGAEERTLVVSERTAIIHRFRKVSRGWVATASSIGEMIVFDLLSRVRLHRLLRPSYRALQGPEVYCGLRIVTPEFVRAAHELGIRVDVWTINSEPDMRRLLGSEVDGVMTDRPNVLARVRGGRRLSW
jgi:glycerophosphoryl diester phosphodiesterase